MATLDCSGTDIYVVVVSKTIAYTCESLWSGWAEYSICEILHNTYYIYTYIYIMIQVSGVCNYPYSNGEHVVDCHWPQTSAPLRRQSPEGLRALC